MARTFSTMLDLGTQAPPFSLPEPATGKTISLDNFLHRPILIAFICNHCPYVVHLREAFVAFAREYQARGLQVIAINANDVENYPADSPEKMREDVQRYNYSFPYLFDESQAVAQAYQAACTPDFFLFDEQHRLYYRGQFDDARPHNDEPVTGRDMRQVADALLAGEAIVPIEQKASLGCNIKWKAGNEPAYYN
jgi:peroxiredoxin